MTKKEAKEIRNKLKDNGGYVCGICAHIYEAKGGDGCTAMKTDCALCDHVTVCLPASDYHWPEELGVKYIWD